MKKTIHKRHCIGTANLRMRRGFFAVVDPSLSLNAETLRAKRWAAGLPVIKDRTETCTTLYGRERGTIYTLFRLEFIGPKRKKRLRLK